MIFDFLREEFTNKLTSVRRSQNFIVSGGRKELTCNFFSDGEVVTLNQASGVQVSVRDL